MNANDQRKFVVRKKSEAELAAARIATKKANRRSVGAVAVAQLPALVGFVLIGTGILIMACLQRALGDYLSTRGGAVVLAAGVAFLAYWGFANRNDNYNF